MGKTYRVGRFMKAIYYNMVDQPKRAHLSYHRLANSTSRMHLDLKCFTEKEKGSKHLTFSKQLKEQALLDLKAQENSSSPLLLEAFKNGSMTVWIHISCWCKRVRLHWASEGLSLIQTDSFLNAANNKQRIFLCFNCRVWHPQVLQGSPRW